MSIKKQRIWELDALRGLCIVCMIVIHFLFDLEVFGGVTLQMPGWFRFVRNYGHVLFVLLSGICATLGSKSFHRGLTVLGGALIISYVTLFMDLVLHMGDLRIWFGILHMLGICMLLYPLFRRLPWWALAILGAAFVALGFWMEGIRVGVDFLFPIGLRSGTVYTGSDYFPMFPGLGWFLLGAALGKTLYRSRQSLLPRVNTRFFLIRFLSFVGRNSLLIYLLHQPVLALAVILIF